jgi:hypothetical protein
MGEYLEYTVFVQQTGNYDIDFRASSPAAGASPATWRLMART